MISTHILDTSCGEPASGVKVKLEIKSSDTWKVIATDKTNSDGRIKFDFAAQAGDFKLTFETQDYFSKKQIPSFFNNTEVCFKISDSKRNYHVPLLLNPFGYSTYRGS